MSIARIIAQRDHAIITCSPDHSVHDAARLLAERRIGALPVVEGGKVVGIFSERDVLYCVAADGAAALNRKVGEVMTAPALTIAPDEPVHNAMALMTRRRIRHLPVVADGELAGFISIGDLVKFRIDSIEEEAQQMRAYITSA